MISDLIQESLKINSMHETGILLGLKGNGSNLYPIFDAQHYRTGVYFDFSCGFSKEVFKKASI